MPPHSRTADELVEADYAPPANSSLAKAVGEKWRNTDNKWVLGLQVFGCIFAILVLIVIALYAFDL